MLAKKVRVANPDIFFFFAQVTSISLGLGSLTAVGSAWSEFRLEAVNCAAVTVALLVHLLYLLDPERQALKDIK